MNKSAEALASAANEQTCDCDALCLSILTVLRRSFLVAVCSEPGYVGDTIVQDTLGRFRELGAKTFYRNFSGLVSDSASMSLVKLARDVRILAKGSETEIVVGLDFLPPSDEIEVARQVRSITKMLDSEALVLLNILPEARQLLESLPAHVLFEGDELYDRLVINEHETHGGSSLYGLTYGIPTLVYPLRGNIEQYLQGGLPVSYSEAVADIVERSLRSSLCEEELLARLAVLVLGAGNYADLRRAYESLSPETLRDLSQTAAFFGVDDRCRCFTCITAGSEDWIQGDLTRFKELAVGYDRVFRRCLEVLGSRGDFVRLSAFLRYASPETGVRIVVAWGPELIDAGYVGLVSDILATEAADSPSFAQQVWSMKRTVRALTQSNPSSRIDVAEQRNAGGRLDEVISICGELTDLRLRLRGKKTDGFCLTSGSSELQRRLNIHSIAMDYIAEGRFVTAMEVLLPVVGGVGMQSVTGCLLQLDMLLAKTLTCGILWEMQDEVQICRDYLASHGYVGLLGYVWIYQLVIEGLTSRTVKTVRNIGSKALRSGDAAVRSLALVSEALIGLRSKPNAYVLAGAGSAEQSCEDIGCEYGSRVSRILAQATRFRMGERTLLYQVEGPDGIGTVSHLVRDAVSEAVGDVVPLGTEWGPIPPNETWLLLVLTEGMGDFSEALAEQIPAEWRRGLEAARKGCMRPVPEKLQQSDRTMAPRACEKGKIRINLLGEFSLWADGRRVPDHLLGKRGIVPLVESLALQPNFVGDRLRLSRSLWPSIEDDTRAMQKIYQATSAARKALEACGFEEEPFGGKGGRTLCFGGDMVSCDVDEFCDCAKLAINGASDARVCENALKAEALYGGDLAIPQMCEPEFFEEKQAELRRTYADAMVCGGEAAMRLGRKRLATRFAHNVLLVDDLREDAAILLIRALRLSGRGAEAIKQYELYVKRLATATSRMPSRQLRQAINEPLGIQGGAKAAGEGAAEAREPEAAKKRRLA